MRKKELVSSSIAQISHRGYRNRYSKASIQWLEWRTERDEWLFDTPWKLGAKGRKHASQAWRILSRIQHGLWISGLCILTNRDQTVNFLTNQSMINLYTLTEKKKENSVPGAHINELWEHEALQQSVDDKKSTELSRLTESGELSRSAKRWLLG